MERILQDGLEATWQLILSRRSAANLIEMEDVTHQPVYFQLWTSNVLALMNSLCERYLPRGVWELRQSGKTPENGSKSNTAQRINHCWPTWQRIEDRQEFHTALLKAFFVFSFIWGVGGHMSGDPRHRSDFESVAYTTLEPFLRLGRNTLDSTRTPRSSAMTSSLASYYPSEVISADSFELTSWLQPTLRTTDEDTQPVLIGGLFNCIIDPQTARLAPFWRVPHAYDDFWPEEFHPVVRDFNDNCTSSQKLIHPTLYHLTPHLIAGHLLAEAGKPLLIRGPQASGKSQLARAVCQHAINQKKINWPKLASRRLSAAQVGLSCKSLKEYAAWSKQTGVWVIEDIHLLSDDFERMNFHECIRKRLHCTFVNSNVRDNSVFTVFDPLNKPPSMGALFLPILTVLEDHSDKATQTTVLSTIPTSLFHRFACISLTDPSLFVSDPVTFRDQHIFGFGPLSCLAQQMMGHGISRMMGFLVQRLCWTMWSVHCRLMRDRTGGLGSSGVSWQFVSQWADAMGAHIAKLQPCGKFPFANVRSKRRTLYSRWTGLLLVDPVRPASSIPPDLILSILDAFCYEAQHLLPLWLPKHSTTQWLSDHLYSSINRYVLQPTPTGSLVPIAYFLLGPSGSLFVKGLPPITHSRRSTSSSVCSVKSRSSSSVYYSVGGRRTRSPSTCDRSRSRSSLKRREETGLETATNRSMETLSISSNDPVDCCSWAADGRLNPYLATQPSHAACLTDFPTALLRERVASSPMLHENGFSVLNNKACSTGCSEVGDSCFWKSSMYADLSESSRVLSWLTDALHQPQSQNLVIFEEDDYGGLLLRHLSTLIHEAVTRCQLPNPKWSDLHIRCALDVLNDSTPVQVIILNWSSGSTRCFEPNRPMELLLKYLNLWSLELSGHMCTDAAVMKRKRPQHIIVILSNTDIFAQDPSHFARWNFISRLTSVKPLKSVCPGEIYVNPIESLKFLLSYWVSSYCGPKVIKELNSLLYFFANAYMEITSQLDSVLRPLWLSADGRLNLLRIGISMWLKLVNDHYGPHYQVELTANAQHGCELLERQLKKAANVCDEERILHEKQQVYWLGQAEANLREANLVLEQSRLAVERAERRLKKLERPLKTKLKSAKMEYLKAGELYQSALRNLYGLSVETLDEIRSYPAPPEPVKMCVYTVCMLFNEEESWTNAKSMMVPVTFVSKVLNFHQNALTGYHYAELKRRLALPDMDLEKLSMVSLAAFELCKWLRALCQCGDALDRLRQEMQQMSGSELHIAEVEAELEEQRFAYESAQVGLEMASRHLDRVRRVTEAHSKAIEEMDQRLTIGTALLNCLKTIEKDLTEDNRKSCLKLKYNHWTNALAAFTAVFLPLFPSDKRISDPDKLSFVNDSDPIANTSSKMSEIEEVIQLASATELLQSTSFELLAWVSAQKFPMSLWLTPSDRNVTHTVQTMFLLNTVLQAHDNLITHQSSLGRVDFVPLLFDPDEIVIDMLLAFNESRALMDLSGTHEDQLKERRLDEISKRTNSIILTSFSSKEFRVKLRLAIETDSWIVISLDDAHEIDKALTTWLLDLLATVDCNAKQNFRLLFITSNTTDDKRAPDYCSWIRVFNPVPIDLSLTAFEMGGAVACAVLHKIPRNDCLTLLQQSRKEEAVLLSIINRQKIQLYTLMSELRHVSLCKETITVVPGFDHHNPLTVKLTKQPRVLTSLDLIQLHTKAVELTTDIGVKQNRLTFVVQQQRHSLERRLSLEAAQLGTLGCVPDLVRQVALLCSLAKDISPEFMRLFRWPCHAACARLIRSCLKVHKAFETSLFDCEQSRVDTQSELRLFCQTALKHLVGQFSNILVSWNCPAGMMLRLYFAICLNRLRHPGARCDYLMSPHQLPEVQWLDRMLHLMEGFKPQFCQSATFNNVETIERVNQLESTFEDLHDLTDSVRTQSALWEETLASPLTFFRPMPGFSAERLVCETHIFLTWITLRPDRLSAAAELLIENTLGQVGLLSTVEPIECENWESLRRDRVDQLLIGAANSEMLREIPMDQNLLGMIYIIFPSRLPVFDRLSTNWELDINVLDQVVQQFDSKFWDIVRIDLSNFVELNAWSSRIEGTFEGSCTLLILENAHLLHSDDDHVRENIWQLLVAVATAMHRYEQEILSTELSETANSVNFLRVTRESWSNSFRVFIDFSNNVNLDQLTNLVISLPGYLRSRWLPYIVSEDVLFAPNDKVRVDTHGTSDRSTSVLTEHITGTADELWLQPLVGPQLLRSVIRWQELEDFCCLLNHQTQRAVSSRGYSNEVVELQKKIEMKCS
ncbi:hypothetical protein EG68_01963 [Paragonimus skrjabini miyazakii]|uniref:Dynein heavy chain coiled coil stalk domain-containing protein n=1 Tax=Paragonimus skrjabini miyazakii TaxID=59628 RepID=A0A8S9ZBF4_9TREM|nr:hypothetical protein EG68_01963 [Paragonimus skrjabini miyazakii]